MRTGNMNEVRYEGGLGSGRQNGRRRQVAHNEVEEQICGHREKPHGP